MSDYALFLNQFDADISIRHQREESLRELTMGPTAEQVSLQSQLQTVQQLEQAELLQIEQEYSAVHAEFTHQFQEELANLQQAYGSIVQSIRAAADQEAAQLERQRSDSEWVVSSVLDDQAEDSPVRLFEKYESNLQKTREEQQGLLDSLQQQFVELAQQRGWKASPADAPSQKIKTRDRAHDRFQKEAEAASARQASILALLLPRLFTGFRGLAVFVILSVLAGIPLYLLADPIAFGVSGPRLQPGWIGIVAALASIGGLLFTMTLYTLGAMRQSDLFRQLEQSLCLADWAHEQWQQLAEEDLSAARKKTALKQKQIEREREATFQRYETALEQRLREIDKSRDDALLAESEKFHLEEAQTVSLRDQQLQKIEEEHHRRLEESAVRWGNESKRLESELKLLQSSQSRLLSEQWMALKSEWETANRLFFDAVNAVNEDDRQTNPGWQLLADGQWTPAATIPREIRFGRLEVDLTDWPHAISEDVRLSPRTTTFGIPGSVPFPGTTSTMFKSPDVKSRDTAIQALQTMMLRMLLLVPPGKLRFTLLDPIGLGESFGGFMHLADYDELLVTNRVWTETGQIEARLADLTEHMENVFQTYLRNEFQTIEEYNESAGEVAEPYHILVISDFPAKFSEIAARRLVSIINSGPRCGVYTLMNIDPAKPLPNGFEMADIEPHMTSFVWGGDAFHATETSLMRWPISIESPPAPQEFTSIVKMVGAASKDARRVEVSFERIAPDSNAIWKGDSRYELEIALGRAGATKLQTMKLGPGTSQHMLVAGKTGSGKSTFLHILVTNLSLHYSPLEVNFFLIDFKKGVEFKDYAAWRLPHAQVVAIESDREFGVSALQRLDEILQERGELFRRHSVQDIAGFRNANPSQPMPRILLLVDEFQEFFVEDDKLSQTAALLLDRLVRQGRAFGIHVILGSQTLGGAYSLARTTLGQVAVRVALQCSEADAHLILSEDNTAARLLTRPGEAIYNDANGMMEGNHPFQIAWLSDQQRRDALQTLLNRSERVGIVTEPAIVFEGNIPSNIERNQHVQKLAETYSQRAETIAAPTIWLGDAVEIQPPTAITFHQQSGSHLLIVGQDLEAAMGILTTAAVTLAASASPHANVRSLYVLDGNPLESEESRHWKSLLELFSDSVKHVMPRETGQVLQELSEQLETRRESESDSVEPLFVIVHNIARFRDLRKAEDDFGMGSFGMSAEVKPVDPAKQFATLLSDGPEYGIHFIIWSDSYNNVERCFSRHTLKELEIRVALQMNAADSSNLIDSPAAARLGTHRALLYREETGLTEKFRPYGTPAQEWLEQLTRTMQHGPASDYATDLEEFSIL